MMVILDVGVISNKDLNTYTLKPYSKTCKCSILGSTRFRKEIKLPNNQSHTRTSHTHGTTAIASDCSRNMKYGEKCNGCLIKQTENAF